MTWRYLFTKTGSPAGGSLQSKFELDGSDVEVVLVWLAEIRKDVRS
jgi:hypothetical protein